ncbi:hypothetical protein Avbf_18663, partial [Armadillidium vulgare]
DGIINSLLVFKIGLLAFNYLDICKSTSDTMQTELQKFGNLAQLSELLNPLWMCFQLLSRRHL